MLLVATIVALGLAAGDSAASRAGQDAPPRWKQNDVWLWQGFEHFWERTFLGFAIPHRLSKLASYIEPTTEPAIDAAPTFSMAQSTGVDGNAMRPRGYYSVISHP